MITATFGLLGVFRQARINREASKDVALITTNANDRTALTADLRDMVKELTTQVRHLEDVGRQRDARIETLTTSLIDHKEIISKANLTIEDVNRQLSRIRDEQGAKYKSYEDQIVALHNEVVDLKQENGRLKMQNHIMAVQLTSVASGATVEAIGLPLSELASIEGETL